MRTRKYFLILPPVIFERSTFESRRHYDLRRRRGNKISQGQRANAHNPNNRRQRFDHLPTSEFHNESLLEYGSIGSPSKRTPRSHPLKIISKEKKVLIWVEGKFWWCFRQLPLAQSLRGAPVLR